MKTITDYADDHVGHPQEIDEDLSVYSNREAFKAGMNKAFDLIRNEVCACSVKRQRFPILHIFDFMDKMQGRKEAEK